MQDSISWKEKREMRLRYDAEADGYDELYSDEQRTKYELAFRRIVFCGADRILDCGCGTGIFLEKVAGRVQFAVGVDLSPKMLERAKLRLGQISNVELVCADIDFLPFSEGAYYVGGHIVAHTNHTRVFLRRTVSGPVRICRLVSSPYLPEGERIFKITEEGIKDISEEDEAH